MNQQTIDDGKQMAMISYFTIIGVIIAFYMNAEKNNNPFTSFHVRQSLGLLLTFFALGYIIGGFDNLMISMSWWIFFAVLLVFGIITAINGKTQPTPILGALYQKLFKNLGK